jgi:succinoglycan biosynthesis transport protein ExoP
MRLGLNGPEDLIALIIRRKAWIIVPFLALSAALAVVISFLPRIYVSEVLILVRPRDVPQDFVKDLIAGTPEDRLKAIEQTLLSRTNLIQILREFGDDLPDFKRLNMDEKVLKLRNQISIIFELEKSRDGKDVPLTYFRISYQNQNPNLAQKIASKLTTLFIEQDNRVRETQVFGTTEFLSNELQKISTDLEASEARVKVIKSKRQFELPDQRETNLRTLDRLTQDRKINAEALDRYATIRLNLETEISQTPPTEPRPVPPPAVIPQPGTRNAQLEDYQKAKQQYDDLAAKYTAKHPEVREAKARMDRLKEQLSSDVPDAGAAAATVVTENGVASSGSMPSQVYQKMVAQLQEVKTELEIREREKAWIESEIAKYSRRVESTPDAEQDIADALRQNDDIKKQYDDLKNKLAQARLSESLESKQKGSQFVIVDPANYPLVPSKPSKSYLLLGSSGAALFLAVGFAALLDIARQRIWTQSQVEAFWAAPVLVNIPEIMTDADLAQRRRKRFLYTVSSTVGAVFWTVCLYIIYHEHTFVLQHLDPVIQKLVYK